MQNQVSLQPTHATFLNTTLYYKELVHYFECLDKSLNSYSTCRHAQEFSCCTTHIIGLLVFWGCPLQGCVPSPCLLQGDRSMLRLGF